MSKRTFIGWIGLSIATPSLATDKPAPASTPAPALPAKVAESDRVVCRTEDTLGSLIRKQRICMTVAQWREVSRQSGDWLEKRTSMKGGRGE